MTCYRPLKVYAALEVNPKTGKRGMVFSANLALNRTDFRKVPCGACIGCRSDRAKAWEVRCLHESKLYEHNCFVTLTFNDQSVAASYSVNVRDWQLFMKRLRFEVAPQRVRYFANGEYGEHNWRPHHHGLLFGYDFPDKRHWRTTDQGHKVYRSELLERLWPYGHCELGDVTAQSAGYVARYCFAKVTGELADEYYRRVSPIDGQVYQVKLEFLVMSRRPGIGSAWFDRFATDAFPSDFVIVDGRKVRPPSFYLRSLSEADQAKVIRRRKILGASPAVRADATAARLRVREEVKRRRLERLKRSL